MDRDLWSGLAIFAAIVEAGSFARAAVRLGLSASALSHAMRSLETKLGVRLLDRTTRSLAPTEAGDALLAQLLPALVSVETALGALHESRVRPAGRVRVNAHSFAAFHVVLPRLAPFALDYPDVAIELTVEDGLVDIVAGRFDCGVRHEGELQRDMISIRISDPVPLVFVAAPAYLGRNGIPNEPADVDRHRCIGYRYTSSGTLHRWEFERGDRRLEKAVASGFVTNDVEIMREAATMGLGIACLPVPYVEGPLAAGDLVEVLPGWAPTLPPNYLYYPSRRQPSAAFRAFADAMRA